MSKKNIYLISLVLLIVGCGDTNTTDSEGEGAIDLRTYLEKESINKNYQLSNKNKEAILSNDYFTENITVSETQIERKVFDIVNSITKISDKKLTNVEVSSEGSISTTYFRHLDIGDRLYTTDINKSKTLTVGLQEVGTRETLGETTCKLSKQLEEFTNGSNTYSGDILKIKCTSTSTITTQIKDEFIGTVSYVNGKEDSININNVYLKKDIGMIALIDDNCLPSNANYVDDTADCSEGVKTHSYLYYLGN